MNDVMIDLETMGTSPGCVIVSIGAVAFDPRGSGIESDFYRDVDMESCAAAGLTFDASTVAWWLKQSEFARNFITRKPRVPLVRALDDLWAWFALRPPGCVWAHGASFDIPILERAYSSVGKKAPWHYRAIRDTRTIFDVSNTTMDEINTEGMIPHYALHDAHIQALGVQNAYRKLKIE